MKRHVIAVSCILVTASFYMAYSDGEIPDDPTPVILCGSYEIVGPCAADGYSPDCQCVAYDKCEGGWNSPPMLNEHDLYEDDYGWQMTSSMEICSRRYWCIPGGINGYCDNDDDCIRDLTQYTPNKIIQYHYVEPFPQWCGGVR